MFSIVGRVPVGYDGSNGLTMYVASLWSARGHVILAS
jgi:hypothetical protein